MTENNVYIVDVTHNHTFYPENWKPETKAPQVNRNLAISATKRCGLEQKILFLFFLFTP